MQKSCGTSLRQPLCPCIIRSGVIVVQSLCLYLLVVLLPFVAITYFSQETLAVLRCVASSVWCFCGLGSAGPSASDVNEQSGNLSVVDADVMVVFKTAILLSWSLLGR